MPPSDEDPAPPRRAASGAEDAFAATVAPTTRAPGGGDDDPPGGTAAPAAGIAAGTAALAARPSDHSIDATIAPSAAPAAAVAAPVVIRASGSRSIPPRTPGALGAPIRGAPIRPSDPAFASSATVAAPLTPPAAGSPHALPPLPEVASELYQAEGEIARGGMGRIVAAEDRRLGRKVALKELLTPSEDQISRFHREALITARLQHPGIVPVYEAGRWPSGEPFFAMKLVAGRPLDRVIAEATTLEARLALLPRIAAATDAIAYAHSKRIIHRDLKPGNILVGEFGETVVIDWGLAKDLDAIEVSENRAPTARNPRPQPDATPGSSTLTVAGAVMGTPAYMAPEQARGEPVDQRADVFALGAMLYHLLAGAPPYNARTATDVIAAAALGNVIPLASRERRAPADLVAIVHRAMAPLPDDRYPDAGAVADELRRFLTGQLVGAHTYTSRQRLARFVRRHQAAVTIATLATLGFAIGGTIAVHKIVAERDEAQTQHAIADVRRRAAEQLADALVRGPGKKLKDLGRLDLVATFGAELRRYYDALAKGPGKLSDADVDRKADAIDLVAIAQLGSGDLEGAEQTWLEMRGRLSAIVARHPDSPQALRRRMIAHVDLQLGRIHQQRGQLDEATAAYELSRQTYAAIHDRDPKDREALIGAAEAHDQLGDLARNNGQLDEAFEQYGQAKAARELALGQANGHPTEELAGLADSHVRLGTLFEARGDSPRALDEYKIAGRMRATLLDGEPDNGTFIEKMLDAEDHIGDLERTVGDLKAAITTYRGALPLTDVLLRRDANNTTWQRNRGNFLANLGFVLLEIGDYRGALSQFDAAISNIQAVAGRDATNVAWQVDLSRFHTRAGDAHLHLGDLAAARAEYQQGLDLRERLVGKAPTNNAYRRSLAISLAKLAAATAQPVREAPATAPATAGADAALALAERSHAIREQLLAGSPSQSNFKNELAQSEVQIAQLILGRDPARAATLIGQALERTQALVAADQTNDDWKETEVLALLASAEAAAAAHDRPRRTAALRDALPLVEAALHRAPQSAHWPGLAAEVHAGLAAAAAEVGDPHAAAEWREVIVHLGPLADAGTLPADRRALLARARAAHPGR